MFDAVDAFDRAVLDTLVAHRVPWVSSLFHAVGVVGTSVTGLFMFALLGLLAVVLTRAWRTGAAVALAAVLADLVVGLLKRLIERPRPEASLQLLEGAGYAFPSTHAAFTSAACAALVASVAWSSRTRRRTVSVLLAAACGLVGAMMVYLGAHWACDVLAGWVLGVSIGVLVGRSLRRRVPA